VVKLYSQQVGKCGELLVQYILLKHGVESAHLTTDRGIDLVAFDSVKQKPVTIQVKTSTHRIEEGDKWLEWPIPATCPAEYIAAVDLERDKFWLFSMEQFKQSSTRHGDNYILWWYVPEDTPEINIKECLVCGSHVELVKGNISDAAKRMNELRKANPGWFDVSTLKEPYRLEGKKTMGYELAEQLDWRLPDVILYPTGGGTGLIGMWKAFDELEQLGWIGSKRPKMISVQSSGCAPIVKAFKEHKPDSKFWENAETIASGLRVPKAFADHLILDAVYKSGVSAVAVSDNEIIATVYEIAKIEGAFVCPEGAAAFAALRYLLSEGTIAESDTVLVFNTAAGIKYPEVVKRGMSH
jgi:cysteine synthase